MKGSFLIFFFLIRSTIFCYSQQQDFGTWNYINLQYKINETWSVAVSEQALRNENATEWWLFIHDLSISQRLSKHFSQELHLRLVNQKKINDDFADREVLFYALNGKWRLKKWDLLVRSRWQGTAYGMKIKDAQRGPYYYHRFRFGISRAINYHWKADLSSELFQPLNRPKRAPIDQIRVGTSLTYRLNRHFSLDHFFQIQTQLKRANPYTYYIIGVGASITL